MPKRRPSSIGTSIEASVTSAPVVDVELQHLAVIHLVDVIAGQDDDVARVFALDRVHVLVDGVGGALVPVLADALLWRDDLDELARAPQTRCSSPGECAG